MSGGRRGLELDAEVHASEECHVMVVTGDGECRPACAEAIRHAKKGASDLKVPKRTRVVSEHEAAQRAEQKAVRESAQARAEFLRELLARRLPKASVIGLVLQAFIRSANQLPAKAACDLLDLEAPPAREDYYGTRAVDELMRYAEAGDAHCNGRPWPWPSPWPRSTWGPRGGRSAGPTPAWSSTCASSTTRATSAASSRTTA